jgi:hypothetical protein
MVKYFSIMPKEGRQERIDVQIAQIEQKLQHGTEPIKQGHRVAGLNPDGSTVEVPLSPTKREKLQWNREVLLFRRDNRYASLPYELERTNPNHFNIYKPSKSFNSQAYNEYLYEKYVRYARWLKS